MSKLKIGEHSGTTFRYAEYCGNCEYSKKEWGHNETFTYCRFNPPLAVAITPWSAEQDKVIGRWPEVPATAWCGQWKRKGKDDE